MVCICVYRLWADDLIIPFRYSFLVLVNWIGRLNTMRNLKKTIECDAMLAPPRTLSVRNRTLIRTTMTAGLIGRRVREHVRKTNFGETSVDCRPAVMHDVSNYCHHTGSCILTRFDCTIGRPCRRWRPESAIECTDRNCLINQSSWKILIKKKHMNIVWSCRERCESLS